MISGFTFIHNAVESGYPIVESIRAVRPFVDEMVVVNMESTDGTLDLLNRMANIGDIDNIILGTWQPGAGGACLGENLLLNERCEGDIIWHFEADEVYSTELARRISWDLSNTIARDIVVWRLQVEQNFQRIRWYPQLVHRIFPKGSVVKDGETTEQHRAGERRMHVIGPEFGYLWDVTNCFRDNWFARVQKQAELWGNDPQYIMVPAHCMDQVLLTTYQAKQALKGKRWMWRCSPWNLPEILKPLLGMVRYEPLV